MALRISSEQSLWVRGENRSLVQTHASRHDAMNGMPLLLGLVQSKTQIRQFSYKVEFPGYQVALDSIQTMSSI